MNKFAHMADVHLGAHIEPVLQKLELQTFDLAMARCVELGVDFVLICGDLFHVAIPDLGVVNSALRSMMQVQRQGIPIYAIYGSHDYTPNGTSVIDVLSTAGVLTNVFKPEFEGEHLKLGITVDQKTGAKLAGISARKIGLESRYYDALDRDSLEKEEGFKVFAFHTGLTELKPQHLSEMETVSVEMLPRGFGYYAGGHIHERGEYDAEGFENIVFPGPLFTGYGRDLEATARGEKRGMYVVEFDDRVRDKKFVPIVSVGGVFREYDLTGKNSKEAGEVMTRDLGGVDVSGRLVVIRAFGELAGGRVGEVGFAGIRSELAGRGAIHVYLSRNSLRSKDAPQSEAAGQDPAMIEQALLSKEVGRVSVSQANLTGEQGAKTALELLRLLRQQAKLGESKKDYVARMTSAGRKTLGVGDVNQN
ncbi:MAG: DNA repair exonuclease [Thaumarchaeota archaeon]|nr:DNA repair exonuclease [Nitrososphaerota archaeon]